ncbi:hypothetical protein [Burkholderia sp. 22PA0106]|uniref:hypothetical protein n=1 Tax=Burkholderia sp. 22PA0106 TaxID=3237371 RepID=UPI0039C4E4E5
MGNADSTARQAADAAAAGSTRADPPPASRRREPVSIAPPSRYDADAAPGGPCAMPVRFPEVEDAFNKRPYCTRLLEKQ